MFSPDGSLVCRWCVRIIAVAIFPFGAFAHGDLHERIQTLQRHLRANPSDTTARLTLAELCFQHADWAECLRQIDEIALIDGEKQRAPILRAKALNSLGRREEAKLILDQFLAKQPDNTSALLERARILNLLGYLPSSIADYRYLLARSPSPDPDWFLEAADLLVYNKEQAEALAVVDEGIRRLGNVPALVSKALEIELLAGAVDAAISRVESVERSAPRPEVWTARKASLLVRAGRMSESKAMWEELTARIRALPPELRSKPSIVKLAEDCQNAVSALRNVSKEPHE